MNKPVARPEEERGRSEWMRIARCLVLATVGYNTIEAAVALWSGVAADSVALVGFGLDSVIEVAAASVLFVRESYATWPRRVAVARRQPTCYTCRARDAEVAACARERGIGSEWRSRAWGDAAPSAR